MSNIIIESVNSKIPFTIDDLFEHTFIIIFAFGFVSVTGAIIIGISKNIKEFFAEKSNRKNKSRK